MTEQISLKLNNFVFFYVELLSPSQSTIMMTSRIAYQLFSYLGLIFLFCMMTGQVAMRSFKIKIPHLCLYFALSTLVNTLRYVTPFSSLQVDGVIEVFLDCQQSKIIYLFISFLEFSQFTQAAARQLTVARRPLFSR